MPAPTTRQVTHGTPASKVADGIGLLRTAYGCFSGCLAFTVLVVVLGGFGLYKLGGIGQSFVDKAMSEVSPLAREFVDQGYRNEIGQIIVITEPVTVPTVYTCQSLTIKAPVDADIAIMAQVVDIRANVRGDITFQGQFLTLAKDATLNGDIDCRFAQGVIVQGTHHGVITGSYQIAKGGMPGQSEPVNAGYQATRERMKKVVAAVGAYVTQHQALPNDEAGVELVAGVVDDWGKTIRYEQNSSVDYVIRSAGPDGVWNNDDDVIDRQRANLSIASRLGVGGNDASAAPEQATPPPTDIDQALAYLESPGKLRRSLGLEWILTHGDAVTDDHRRQVVDASLNLLEDAALNDKAVAALQRWITPDRIDELVEKAQHPGGNGAALLTLLIELKSPTGVAAFVNHIDQGLRNRADQAVRTLPVSQEIVLRQCLRDLENVTRQSLAIERLSAQPALPEPFRSEVQQVLLERIAATPTGDNQGISLGINPFDPQAPKIGVPVGRLPGRHGAGQNSQMITMYHLLERLGIRQEHVPALVRVVESRQPLAEQASHSILQLRDPRGFTAVIGRLGEMRAYTEQMRYLKQIEQLGPVAEPYAWPLLDSKDRDVVKAGCLALGAIGTERSLPRLTDLGKQSPAARVEADQAMYAIRAAQRTPVDLPPNWLETRVTRSVMDAAETQAQGLAAAQGSLPAAAEIVELINARRDGWGHALTGEPREDGSLEVRSAGPDGRMKTADDLVEISPHAAPQDENAVATALRSGDRSQQRSALDWLLAGNEVSDAARSPLTTGLILLANDPLLHTDAMSALKRVFASPDAGKIVAALGNHRVLPVRVAGFDAGLLQLLIDSGATEAMLPIINGDDSQLRALALPMYEQGGGSEPQLVEAALTALKRKGGDANAAAMLLGILRDHSVDPAQQAALQATALRWFDAQDGKADVTALAVYSKFGVQEKDMPVYDRLIRENARLRNQTATLLAESGEPFALDYLSEILTKDEWTAAMSVTRSLADLGPAAETRLWPGLESQVPVIRRLTATALGKAGTQRSVEKLQPLTTDEPDIAKAAQEAINQIEKAKRTPVD